jgi:serine/threonine-protein kinase
VTPLDELPAALALEVDALCDDFERHWQRSRRRGQAAPTVAAFVERAAPAARAALLRCLLELERDLLLGVALPDLPGLALVEEIGRGGMGVVYRARREDGRDVALKLIPGEEHARWSAWMEELAGLRHPHLVPLEAFGCHGGLHYVVMPLVCGGDLKERLGEFALGPAARVARLLAQVSDAVGHLHAHGIVHRDLKPSNVLLSGEEGPEPLVCDFGLAARLGAGPGGLGVVGTPPYAAPEQLEGRGPAPSADIWSLGVVLHELLTGRPLSASITPGEPILGAICRRCLALEPTGRYRDGAELAAALRLAETAS